MCLRLSLSHREGCVGEGNVLVGEDRIGVSVCLSLSILMVKVANFLLNETIAQGHLFTACTFLLQTSQPKDLDLRGKKARVMKRSACTMVSQ